jgi:hypothetical protein
MLGAADLKFRVTSGNSIRNFRPATPVNPGAAIRPRFRLRGSLVTGALFCFAFHFAPSPVADKAAVQARRAQG